MRVCVVSSKECWQEEDGSWRSFGGFPLQMDAIRSLFGEMTLLVVRGARRPGGIPLPPARVVPLRKPMGTGWKRKLSVIAATPYYLFLLLRHSRDADVVHVPLPGDIPLVALLAALGTRRRVLGRYASSWETTSRTTLMNRVTKGLMRRVAGGRNVMLATGVGTGEPAPGMRWLFATAIGTAEVRSVHPDLERPPREPLRLIYAGRLSSEKGVEYLVNSIRLLREIDPRLVSLTVAGDGPRRDWMMSRLRESGCEEIVRFAGLLDRGGLLRELLQSDLCVLPSLTESFCKARLDAMLCGVPVLTTEVGFGRTIVGEDGERGWIIPAADANAIAASIARIVRDTRDWPALRARCHSYVTSMTLEEWTRKIGEICAAQWNMSLRDGRLCFR